jgi:hypothetical protein
MWRQPASAVPLPSHIWSTMRGSMAESAQMCQIGETLMIEVIIGQVVHVLRPPLVATLAPAAATQPDQRSAYLPSEGSEITVVTRPAQPLPDPQQ